jgi:hypothetical protein
MHGRYRYFENTPRHKIKRKAKNNFLQKIENTPLVFLNIKNIIGIKLN